MDQPTYARIFGELHDAIDLDDLDLWEELPAWLVTALDKLVVAVGDFPVLHASGWVARADGQIRGHVVVVTDATIVEITPFTRPTDQVVLNVRVRPHSDVKSVEVTKVVARRGDDLFPRAAEGRIHFNADSIDLPARNRPSGGNTTGLADLFARLLRPNGS